MCLKVRIIGKLRTGEKRYSMMENVAGTHGIVSTSDGSISSTRESSQPAVSTYTFV